MGTERISHVTAVALLLLASSGLLVSACSPYVYKDDIAAFSKGVDQTADAFDALRRRYRSDPRASLAALELGRLRLNHLGDPSGALDALEDAVQLGPRAALREEAELRIIDALWALGRAVDCARARDEFIARHPRSVHTSSMSGRCAAR